MKSNNTRKRPYIEISDSDDTDGDDLFGNVPKDIEKVRLDDLVVVDMLKITLIISSKTCKEVYSTSFNLNKGLHQER